MRKAEEAARILREMRIDMARDTEPLIEAGLDALLTEIAADSEANLLASCVLLALDHENVVERAAIVQYDGGLSRAGADRQAVVQAVGGQYSELDERLAGTFFDSASAILDTEIANGWTRRQTIDALAGYLNRERRRAV